MQARFRIMVGAATVVIAMCGIAPAQSGDSAQPRTASAPAATLPPIYQRWLDEDVVYIITPEERTAFLRLPTEEERDHFIVQFWLRRDPTPDTEENEYKEEHYRRIAFANENFAAGKPGWKSDRGRIYITDGPPDEIIQHTTPLADDSELKSFVWHYNSSPDYPWQVRYSEGKRETLPRGTPADFVFVDRCQCGDFQLQSPGAH